MLIHFSLRWFFGAPSRCRTPYTSLSGIVCGAIQYQSSIAKKEHPRVAAGEPASLIHTRVH